MVSIQVIADCPTKLFHLRSQLTRLFDVTGVLLDAGTIERGHWEALVVAVDIGVERNITLLKEILPPLKNVPMRIFVVEVPNRRAIVQAFALGATEVLPGSAPREQLVGRLLHRRARERSIGADISDDPEAVASAGAAALRKMFLDATAGEVADVVAAEGAARRIADCIAEEGLTRWLDTVRHHHEGTYQHCLLVMGVAVDFGVSLGMTPRDIQRLNMAAMFHDIGKAQIPISILDKPGALDPHERQVIETHPVIGYELLKGTEGISCEVLDAVRHHHEYLDGSGYPDRLSASHIADVVRILTISDVFAALIEDRRYRPAMSCDKAYDILCGMRGKLEWPLVVAFKNVALSR